MDKIHRDCSIRIIVGILINLAIVIPAVRVISRGLPLYTGVTDDSNFQIAVIGGVAAAISLVLTARVLWRGVSWQQVVGVVLIPIPAILLFNILRLWIRGY